MRVNDWPTALYELIEEYRFKEFQWGEHDCCLFAADCCIAVCGTDPAASYRGKYTTEIGAKRALKQQHGSIEGAFDACFARVDANLAQRGDVVLFDGDLGPTAGIQGPEAVVWSVGLNGLATIRPDVKVAWRVE